MKIIIKPNAMVASITMIATARDFLTGATLVA
jgi:hypothetical protein